MQVSRSKARYSAERAKYTTSRITVILIAIIVLHVVLVCPSLSVSFLVETIANKHDMAQYFRYLTAMVITNVMQTLNFAINFILYCIISKTFRENLKGRTCNIGTRIHSTLKTTPRSSSGGGDPDAKHRYQLVDMTNPTLTTRVTASTKNNGTTCRLVV